MRLKSFGQRVRPDPKNLLGRLIETIKDLGIREPIVMTRIGPIASGTFAS
jgi:hypothetical protein